jgi:hypothetical protein
MNLPARAAVAERSVLSGSSVARPTPTSSSVNVATEIRASPSGGSVSGLPCSAATNTLVSTR